MYSTAEKITTVDSLTQTTTRKIINIHEHVNGQAYERGESWHLVNLEEIIFNERMKERQEMIDRQRKNRKERKIKAAERKKRMRIMCVQKFSGLTLVVGSVIAGAIIGNITFGILTIPVGLLMLFLREPCLVIKNKKKCDTESVRA